MKRFLIDSVSAITAEMAGQVVVTGSHGGTSAARLALTQPPALAVFNDAGIGLDGAGIAGLAILNQHGIAAFAVSHQSARIGDAASTETSGQVSAANAIAAATGVVAGQTTLAAIEQFVQTTSA